MAAAMPSVFSSKLKLIEPPRNLIFGDKFIKWSEVSSFFFFFAKIFKI
jgi:hypothetical protein